MYSAIITGRDAEIREINGNVKPGDYDLKPENPGMMNLVGQGKKREGGQAWPQLDEKINDFEVSYSFGLHSAIITAHDIAVRGISGNVNP